MKRSILILILLSGTLSTAYAQFAHPSATAAQEGFNPAQVHTTDALFLNPANLQQTPGMHIALFQVGALTGGNLLRFDLYNQYLASGQRLTGTEVEPLLNSWFGNETALRTLGSSSQFIPFSLVYSTATQSFGLALRMRQHQRMRLNRGLLDILLKGTGEDRSVALNGSLQTMSFSEVVLGYARNLMDGRLQIGIAPRILFGAQATDASLESTVTFSSGTIRHTYTYQIRVAGALNDMLEGFDLFDNPEPNDRALDTFGKQMAGLGSNGTGFGISLGARYQVTPRLHVGISLTDVGAIRWTTQARSYTPVQSVFEFDGITLDLQRLRDEYDGNFGEYLSDQLDSLARAAYEEVRITQTRFRSPLPAALHTGAAYSLGKTTTIGLSISLGLNDAAGNLSRQPLVTLAGRTRVLVFPLFAGIRGGGEGALTLFGGTGLRLGPFSLLLGAAGTPKSSLMGTGSRFGVMIALVGLNI